MTKNQKKLTWRAGIAVFLWLAFYLLVKFVSLPFWANLLLFLIPYAVIGYDVVLSAFKHVLTGQILDERLLMLIATVGAFVVGEYPEGVAVMILYQIGELFQSIAVGKSRKSIQSLLELQPEEARVLRENQEVVIEPEEVEIGEILLVKAGEKIPLDGIVTEGIASLDTSALTGESLPADVKQGDTVMSGCIVLNGCLQIETTADFENTTVSKILEMVENASDKKSKSEDFIAKFAKYYTPVVVISALLLALLPPLFTGINDWNVWQEWIKRACTFLVVSCPCALVISVPLSFFGGIGGCAKTGILVKGARELETLSKVKTVLFDKTGTLTEGRFSVVEIHAESGNREELLQRAASLEKYSSHPIAKCIVQACEGISSDEKICDVRELSGYGMEGKIDGKTYYVGNKTLLEKNGVAPPSGEYGTVVFVASEDEYLGYITVADCLKKETQNAVSMLRKAGVEKIVLLTGDRLSVAQKAAEEIGADDVKAELLPYQKVEELEKFLGKKGKVIFVGDGINDAPVLMRADVGISMGNMGSDAAIEASDIVLTDDNPAKVAVAVLRAKKTMRIVYANIVFALTVKVAVLLLSAFGLTSMWLAVFADVGVCILAVLNAIRTLRKKA